MVLGKMARLLTSGEVSGGSQEGILGNRNSGGREFFEFQSERFFSSQQQSSNDYCPYSLRQSQLSINYQYDILLIYDPGEDSFYTDKLMEYLEPQKLNIFDFIRDSPPGLPQRKILQSALQACRYTCIVITKKFISNFWLQLKTDMSIQDMLDRGNKMYSVIVVVMDPVVKKEHLPLDLATLSPLFYTEKFFENRLKLAFQNQAPFTKSLPLPQLKQPATSRDNEKCYSQFSTASYNSNAFSNQHHFLKGRVSEGLLSKSSARLPQENQESDFSPIHFRHGSQIQADPSTIERGISITVSSTGCRKPQESSDLSLMERAEAMSTNFVAPLQISADSFRSMDSHMPREDNFGTANRMAITTEKFFSISSCKDIVPPEIQSEVACSEDSSYGVQPSTFFKSDQPMEETMSTLSDLEISIESLQPEAESRSKLETYHVQDMEDPQLSELPAHKSNEILSLPLKLHQNESMPESNPKKSRSVRSLVGNQIYKIRSSFSLHRKKH